MWKVSGAFNKLDMKWKWDTPPWTIKTDLFRNAVQIIIIYD